MPTILNGANEAAVELFLDEKISFLRIPQLIELAMRTFEEDVEKELTLENIIDLDRRVKTYVRENAN